MSRFLITIFAIISFTLPISVTPCFAKEPFRTIEGIVIKVSDGDSIQVMDSLGTKVKVRLYGIDAPETAKINRKTGHISKQGQPYGEEAHRALKLKVYHQKVRLDVMDIDKYHRAVCFVWIGDRSINKEMVADGYAFAYRKYLRNPYSTEYIQAEDKARSKGIGLWQQETPQAPWEFRKMQKGIRGGK